MRVGAVRPVAGGDVNRAARARLGDGRDVFVKWRPGAPPGAFAAEAEDLRWLRVAGGPRIPRVLAVGDDPEARFLALEWLPPSPPGPGYDERLGRALAALHLAGAPAFGRDAANLIGPLPQPTGPAEGWPEFYGRYRLAPMAARARRAGVLDAADMRRSERLVDRLPGLLGPGGRPDRLHGDLWSGNAHAGPGGEPVLVDPAAYGGDGEMDLAMMRLFGGFAPRVFDAYDEVRPPAPGRDDRLEIHQLYPLLVHAVLFGGGYAGSVRRILGRVGG